MYNRESEGPKMQTIATAPVPSQRVVSFRSL